MFDAILKIFRAIMREVAPGIGREADWETATRYTGNPDEVEQRHTATRYFDLSLNPYIYAGLRYRDISRLWISATGIHAGKGGGYSNPQILLPPTQQRTPDTQTAEILAFVRWNIDERLQRGMKSIIQRMQHASLVYGRSVQEIMWATEENGTHFGRVVIDDIKDRDPERFVINPKGEKPGVYLRETLYSMALTRMPERKFMVLTNNPIFENPYGISELRPFAATRDGRKSLDELTNSVLDFWSRGLEKAGKGAWIGTYGNELVGEANKTKRANFLEEIRKIANDTVTIKHKSCEIDTIKADLESAAFQSFLEMQIAAISIVLTGSATALQEGKFGSYSKEESTTVRQKSDLEQMDATAVSDAFSYQALTWLVDYNFADVMAYPFVQIIEPDLIMPTTPEGQKTEEEIDTPNGNETPLTVGKTEGSIAERQTMDAGGRAAELTPNDTSGNTKSNAIEPQEFAALGGVSPDATPAPEHFADTVDAARQFLDAMPVKLSEDFDILPESQKRGTFTISRLTGKNALITLAELKGAIADTIDKTNESEAWPAYYKQAQEIMKRNGTNMLSSDLFVSFRFARQAAYLAGTLAYANEHADALHGLLFATQEDPRVRITHKRFQGVVRPVGDSYWDKVAPPLDFNCRCYLKPILKADAAKYPYTPTNKLPAPLKSGWGHSALPTAEEA